MEQQVVESVKVSYDVITELAGHQSNQNVDLVTAAKDIFRHVKEKAMQVAVNGAFKTFQTMDELQDILTDATHSKYSIRLYDEDYQG